MLAPDGASGLSANPVRDHFSDLRVPRTGGVAPVARWQACTATRQHGGVRGNQNTHRDERTLGLEELCLLTAAHLHDLLADSKLQQPLEPSV